MRPLQVFLAGTESRLWILRYLLLDKTPSEEWKPYILQSFYYSNSNTERLLPYFGDFLLDSGAFTFIKNQHVRLDWNEYINQYADFIIRNKIKKYFELDIDSIVGYEQVKQFRMKLESKVGWKSIPVWHPSRGTNEYLRLCEEYPYVAIGGISIKEISKEQYKAFPSMIQAAHDRGARVHGLGFTNLEGIRKYHFDSVDSTAWTTGNRFGLVYHFTGKTLRKLQKPQAYRLNDSRETALHNYIEWIKFQKYAASNL